jgi:hypothetical protein
MRDLKAVGVKFQSVLYPREKKSLLKECKPVAVQKYFLLIETIFQGIYGDH